MSKNADIRSFLKSKIAPRSQPQPLLHSASLELSLQPPGQAIPSSSPPSPLGSRSPSLPPPRQTQLPSSSTSRVIEDSDDGLSDSDEGLPSLLWSTSRDVPAPAPCRPRNPCVTPKAKRIAVVDFSSPLSVRARHAFDFKTLLEHEDEHKRSLASMKLADAEMKDDDSQSIVLDSPRKFLSPRHLCAREIRKNIVKRTIHDNVDAARRAERAMEKVNAGSEKGAWYFFDPETTHPLPRGPEFPVSAPRHWKRVLGDKKSRPRHLASALPVAISAKAGVPDDVLDWILRQLPCESSPPCAEQYTRIVASANSNQIALLVQPAIIIYLFEKLGAMGDLADNSELAAVLEVKDAYKGRDWSGLISILTFLDWVAPQLVLETLISIGVLVLRMSADEAVMQSPGVQDAVRSLMVSILDCCPEHHWSQFCQTISQSLFSSFQEETFLQIQVVHSLPLIIHGRVRHLRKGLATAFLFGDPSLITEPTQTSLQDFSTRLQQQDLKPSRDADYTSIRNLALLWEAAIDDGSPSGKPETEFNHDVDVLIQQIDFLQTSVKSGDAGAVARLQTKEYLVGLTSRLQLSIRTEPPRKKDQYDEAKERAVAKENEEQKQKSFMGRFLASPSSKTRTDGAVNDRLELRVAA